MSWDGPIHSFSYPNGEPQTPTRTPTSAAFADSAFQTPKLESSFYDPRVTWNTADPYASSPEFLKTPQRFGLSTPGARNLQHATATEESFAGQQTLSPQIARASSVRSRNTASARKNNRQPERPLGYGDEDEGRIADPAKRSAASMQTPPPTSTARRKLQQQGRVTPSLTKVEFGMLQPPDSSHLETPSRIVGMVSPLFGGQDSSDMFRMTENSVTASPFFPQNRLFWDQDSNFAAGTADSSNPYGSDPFGPSTQRTLDLPGTIGNNSLQVPRFQGLQPSTTGAEPFSDASTFIASPMGNTNTGGFHPVSFSTSPRVPPARDDDPAMFLSSPARRFGFPETTFSPTQSAVETRQPYYYQTVESKREKQRKELKRAKSLSRRKTDSAEDSIASLPDKAIGRPGVRRSATHAGMTALNHTRQQSQQSYSSTSTTGSGVRKTSSRGRVSPLKTQVPPFPRPTSASTLTAPLESLVLKIGKDGRAKTEMKVVGRQGADIPLDDSSESETDSSDGFNDDPIVPSRTTSFNFDTTPRRASIAPADSVSRPQSKCSSYSSTVASFHSGPRSPWAGSSRGSARRSHIPEGWMSARRSSLTPRAGHSRGPSATDSEITQIDEDHAGDAQHALKQVLMGRSRHVSRHHQHQPPHYGSVSRSSRSVATLRSSPPIYGQFDAQSGGTSSPTTMTDPDVPTPIVDRQSNPSNGTRCICNSMDNGGHLMIQCESCTHWLHTKCVGLDRQSLPPVYICVYCSQTPMRGGRVRDRLTSSGGHAPPSSPLAHKSYRR
ncbi:hypothetical protein AJ80_03251 [Polytolypa hystricis UAMH7299]|uniref:PHD-type domain-containing protein n=1 Tax=Polytolypa hystricis (strain UAMH7299) TaxID=1447883 RepID=A0A2B7YJV5_POLH7|nr:hypothetical protein AJ80_03251 [Polytolypa hystricis UAMH7299]